MSYTKLFAREYSVQYADVCLRMASPELRDHVPLVSKTFAWFPEDGNEVLCQATNDWQDFLKEVESKYSDAATQDQFIDAFHRYGKEYVATAQQLGSLEVSSLSNQELLDSYEKYFSVWILYTAYLWGSFVLNEILAGKGQHILSKKSDTLVVADDTVATLLAPSQKSGILKLQEDLAEFKQRGVAVLEPIVIKKILREYAWMPCLDLQNDPWTDTDVQDFYQQLSLNKEVTMGFGEAVQQAALTPPERTLFKYIKEFSYIKDMRDIYRRTGVHASLPFFSAVGERLEMDRKDVAYLTHDELSAALRGNSIVDSRQVSDRKRGFLMYWEGEAIVITTDSRKITAFKKNFIEENTKEIKGVSASRGKAKGRVKIVRGVEDLKKVNAGDILIAITTHPDFVPAMQRAAAFVTDEGGLTSHAAIVAREMKKPCIVGSKIATKILKDNDNVEIDADKGIVTILPQ